MAKSKENINPTKIRLDEIEKELADLRSQKDALIAHWNLEKDLIKTIRASKEEIENLKAEADRYNREGDLAKVAEINYGKIPELDKKIDSKSEELAKVQKEKKMLKEEVDAEDIAEIVSRWTGIPVTKMLEGERQKLLKMEENLAQRLVGQEDAVVAVSNAIRRSRAGLQDENRPIGSFIFLGTTGTGKTELARALAEFLFDDEKAIVRIDMSEYMEKFAVSRLIGAPPGYVGYEEGGQLTEAVRRKPYCVVLLDEIEKAHPDVFNILLQVLDEGRLTDSKGKTVNFKNTIIIMTSNLGAHLIQQQLEKINDKNRDDIMGGLRVQLLDMLKATIRPEFLNRIDEIILFKPLTKDEIRLIVDLQLNQTIRKLEHNQIKLKIENDVKDWLGQLGYDIQFGARPLKRVIQKYLTNKLSEKILSAEILPGDSVTCKLDKSGTIEFIKEKTK
ncbi:MAG TPA: chaperone protein ClpB [Bacteroidetes bacterium]|nr:AAA family ATPase [Ignavibacteria bacterium]HCA43251.1 chaperone protein ClpB [Bacteroidota bacterium]HCN38560.1 chaperone protein ClpB [Bacteroidota bacterium]